MQFELTSVPPSPRQHISVPREIFSAVISSAGGKWEHVSGCLVSPAVQDAAKEAHCSLASSRILGHVLNDWEWEEAGRVADRILRGIKGLWILLIASWTPLRSPLTSCWAYLTPRSLQLAQSTPQHSVCPIHTPPHPMAAFLCTLLMVVSVSYGRWLVSMHRQRWPTGTWKYH